MATRNPSTEKTTKVTCWIASAGMCDVVFLHLHQVSIVNILAAMEPLKEYSGKVKGVVRLPQSKIYGQCFISIDLRYLSVVTSSVTKSFRLWLLYSARCEDLLGQCVPCFQGRSASLKKTSSKLHKIYKIKRRCFLEK